MTMQNGGTAPGLTISCQEVVELVTDYLEGALPEERARLVREHLDQCVDCLRYLGQIQLTVQLLSRLSVEETSLSLPPPTP